MKKSDFITKMLELGAELEKANAGIQCNMIINDANLLYDKHFAQTKANGAERSSDKCHIQNVSNMLPEELCKLHGHAMYSVYSINNTANGNSSFFGLNKCSRCGYEEPWQYDF